MARFKYLKKKADVKGQLIKQYDEQFQKKKEKQKKKEENIKVAKRYRLILKGIDNKFVKLKTLHQHQSLEKFYKPQKKGLPEPLDIPTDYSKFSKK